MTNYEAIQSMSPEQMEDILDQIYLAGLNNGMFAARQEDDSILDTNPFDLRWLCEPAEKAVRFETDEAGDDYMLCALHEAIFRNVEMSRNVQSGNTQNLKSSAASNQAAVCACAHSRYFTGGSPSGLRV